MILSNIQVSQETLDEVKKTLDEDPHTKDAINLINDSKKNYTTYSIVGGLVGFFVSFIILMIIFGVNDNVSFGAILGLVAGLILGLVIFFAVKSYGDGRVKKMMMDSILPLILEGALKEKASYYPSGIFDNKYLRALNFFRCTNIKHNEAMEGICLGVPFTCEDVNTYHLETYSNGKTTSTRTVQDFNGTVFRLRYSKPSRSIIYIGTKINISGLFIVTGPQVNLEVPEFTSNYYVIDSDKEDAFRVLTPEVQYRFDDMTKITNASALYKIENDTIEIAFAGPTQSIVNFKGSFGPEDLPGILKGILFIKALIKTLGLDNTYWLDVEKNKNLVNSGDDHKEANYLDETGREGGEGIDSDDIDIDDLDGLDSFDDINDL